MNILLCSLYQQNQSLYLASADGDLVEVQEAVNEGADINFHNHEVVSLSVHDELVEIMLLMSWHLALSLV